MLASYVIMIYLLIRPDTDIIKIMIVSVLCLSIIIVHIMEGYGLFLERSIYSGKVCRGMDYFRNVLSSGKVWGIIKIVTL